MAELPPALANRRPARSLRAEDEGEADRVLQRNGRIGGATAVISVARRPIQRARLIGTLSAAATVLAIGLTLAGVSAVDPGVPPWPRFWATIFFILLIWPVGLTLVGRLAGVCVQAIVAGVLLAGTAWQQYSHAPFPLPLDVGWQATLAAPGDAVRQRIVLPSHSDPTWRRAWERAARAAVAVCTERAVAPEAGVEAVLAGAPPVPLASLRRNGRPGGVGWYDVPLARDAVQGVGALVVEVRRTSASGGAAAICGGRDNPRRPGAGGAARWVGGRWSAGALTGSTRAPAAGRYYIEIRFYDQNDVPSFGIWY